MFVANTFPAGAVAVKSGPGNNCPCFLLFTGVKREWMMILVLHGHIKFNQSWTILAYGVCFVSTCLFE